MIQAGEGFDATYQVESITDDKDERSFLFGQIQISGDYSTDEPGTYTLTYTAMDSDQCICSGYAGAGSERIGLWEY